MRLSVRSRSSLALALATSGVLLAGCHSGDDAGTTSAAGSTASAAAGTPSSDTATRGAGASGATCGYDAADTFVVATTAEDQGGTVVVTANAAHVVCGGADNGHVDTDADPTTLQLAPSAVIELLDGSGPDLDPAPVAPAAFPARLAADPGALFQVIGPATAVTGLTEVYRP